MELPQNIKNRTTIWSSNSNTGYSSKEKKPSIQRDICALMFITVLAKDMEVTYISTDTWMDKKVVIYKYSQNHEKEWNLAICDNTDGPRGCYAKWNKSDRERQIQYHFSYMWNLKKQMKKQNKIEMNL